MNASDGFGEARALSPRFAIASAPPTVQIARPLGDETIAAGDRVLLTGTAFDDAHRELSGRALTWYAGHRLLGHGRRLRTTLPAARVVLRLVASAGPRAAVGAGGAGGAGGAVGAVGAVGAGGAVARGPRGRRGRRGRRRRGGRPRGGAARAPRRGAGRRG